MGQDIEVVQNTFDALKRKHIAANDANDKLLIKNNELQNEIDFLKTSLVNATTNLDIQKMIVSNAITSSQEIHERDYSEIEELKSSIKELKNEIVELKNK